MKAKIQDGFCLFVIKIKAGFQVFVSLRSVFGHPDNGNGRVQIHKNFHESLKYVDPFFQTGTLKLQLSNHDFFTKIKKMIENFLYG